MLKKTLLALSVAWTGTAAAASSSLDDVTMNIVNETAFQEIISANPAEIEKILEQGDTAKPMRTIVLRNLDGTLRAGTPIDGQVFTVSRELNQGMVTFSFVCSEAQDACQKRVEELSSGNGFTLTNPADGQPGTGFGVHVIGPEDANAVPVQIITGDGAAAGTPTFVRNGEPGAGGFKVEGGAVQSVPPASGQ